MNLVCPPRPRLRQHRLPIRCARAASLLIWLATTLPTSAAEALEQRYVEYGQLIVRPFASAPFPHPARAAGHQYKDKAFPAAEHYADSTVALFLPKGFRETGRVDFVIHFHGWYNSVAGALKQFQLIEQFCASGRNAVLVVPEGPRDAPDSFGGKLEDQDGFRRFMEETVATLRQQGDLKRRDFVPGNIILSGHSGGYRVMAAILDRGGLAGTVKEVWLFDGLYAEAGKFLAWWDREGGRFINIYTDGGGTKDQSEAMMARLQQHGTPFLAADDQQVTPAGLRAGRLIFLHTTLGHNDVLEKRRTFGQFLETSCLEAILHPPATRPNTDSKGSGVGRD